MTNDETSTPEPSSRTWAYRPAEAAKLLSMSREMVFKLLEVGAIKGYRVGAARFISHDELTRFFEAAQAGAYGSAELTDLKRLCNSSHVK